jgi:predicted SnoaL-like aldol condensation-catalyzing enzyme
MARILVRPSQEGQTVYDEYGRKITENSYIRKTPFIVRLINEGSLVDVEKERKIAKAQGKADKQKKLTKRLKDKKAAEKKDQGEQ